MIKRLAYVGRSLFIWTKMTKLSKRQRAKLISSAEREHVMSLTEEHLLALHDLTHEVMEIRFGTTSRVAAEDKLTKTRLNV